MPDDPFTVASDIGERLAELRGLLGEDQKPFAERFGRDWKQVSRWEQGHQRPRPSNLRRAARKNDWPLGIFTEGGPRPTQALGKAPSSPAGTRIGEGTGQGLARREADLVRAEIADFMKEHPNERAPWSRVLGWVERLERRRKP